MVIENWRPRKCYVLFYGVVDSIGELNIRDELSKEAEAKEHLTSGGGMLY
jgi:hypothetical protein